MKSYPLLKIGLQGYNYSLTYKESMPRGSAKRRALSFANITNEKTEFSSDIKKI